MRGRRRMDARRARRDAGDRREARAAAAAPARLVPLVAQGELTWQELAMERLCEQDPGLLPDAVTLLMKVEGWRTIEADGGRKLANATLGIRVSVPEATQGAASTRLELTLGTDGLEMLFAAIMLSVGARRQDVLQELATVRGCAG